MKTRADAGGDLEWWCEAAELYAFGRALRASVPCATWLGPVILEFGEGRLRAVSEEWGTLDLPCEGEGRVSLRVSGTSFRKLFSRAKNRTIPVSGARILLLHPKKRLRLDRVEVPVRLLQRSAIR